ncbi:MAG: tetratricopeptide repeat protein [Raineya sp.]|nr:tetratricopeptide repeat protein [Raineya sp.]
MTKIKHFEEKAKKKAQEKTEITPVETTEGKENILENPEIVWDKSEEFLRKNQKTILIVLAGLLVGIGAYFGWRYYTNEQEKSASAKLYPAEYFFRNDSLNKVLKGEKDSKGKWKYWSAPKVADEYPLTQSAELAHFYTGIALLKEGKFKEAIKELEKFSSSDKIIQGRAYCLIGDAYMELNQLDNAISYYRKAAYYYTNQYYSPMYLTKLALAYELKNDYKNAIAVYDEIIKEHYNSQERTNAQKYKARLETMQSK